MAGWSGRRSATPIDTVNNDLPTPRRSPPWLSSLTPRRGAAPNIRNGVDDPNCVSATELARHRRSGPRRGRAPDLRLPHLGAVRPDPHRRSPRSSASRPAPCRAISAAGSISCSSASSRSGRRMPTPLSAHHPRRLHRAELLDPARSSCCCSPGRRSSAWSAPSSCAAAISNMSRAARALGLSQHQDHVQAPAAQRHGGDPDLHALHHRRLDRRRSPRSTSSASACRPARPRSASCCRRARTTFSALARHHRLLHRLDHAVAPRLHRRGGARRLRSAKDLPVSAADRCSTSHDLSRRFRARAASVTLGRRAASPSPSPRARRWRWSANRAPASRSPRCRSCRLLPYPSASHPSGAICFKRRRPARRRRARRCARCAATTSP